MVTAHTLSTLYPLHESAIKKNRLRYGAELRRVSVRWEGRQKVVDIFFARGFDLFGLKTIRVLFDRNFRSIELLAPKMPEVRGAEGAPERDMVVKGIAASSGVAIGSPLLWLPWEKGLPIKKFSIDEKGAEQEISRFREALRQAKQYYEGLISDSSLDNATSTFEMHLLLMEDIAKKVESGIKNKQLNAEHILEEVVREHAGIFERMDNPYFKERIADIKNVARVLLEKLSGINCRKKIEGDEVILVAEEIFPSDMGEIMRAKAKVLALVTERGGPTSHAALIAKELGIPAVLGVEKATRVIRDTDLLVVDGRAGSVVRNPSEVKLAFYSEIKSDYDLYVQKLRSEVRGKIAQTKDGYRVILGANIMSAAEFEAAKAFEIDEVGLLRTEGLFLERNEPPSEKTHYETYRALNGMPVKIRTFDLGGDKLTGRNVPEEMRLPPESQSPLGLRGVRLYQYNGFWQDMFRTQVRSALRASAENAGLSIMFPMVSKLAEFRWARGVVEEEKEKLIAGNIKFNRDIKVGVMIEVPSTLAIAPLLANEADYFSFGSNDMIQHLLAVDRVNPLVASLYDPFHYSLIWWLRRIIWEAHKVNKPVSLCGDMGADPLAAFLLVGLEIDGISMVASDVPKIKYVLLGLEREKVRDFTLRILGNYPTTAPPQMSIRGQIKEAILKEFPLDVSERINLVEGKLSPSKII